VRATYRGGSAGLLPGTVHTEVATPMLPTLCAVARALPSTIARSSPAAADAPATCVHAPMCEMCEDHGHSSSISPSTAVEDRHMTDARMHCEAA